MKPFKIRDEVLEDTEVREVVKGLEDGRAGGASKV